MDPLQWMGAIRMRVQTTDKNNPQVIHMTPVLTLCEVKKMNVLSNKFSINMFLTSNHCFLQKIQVLYQQ